MRISIGYHSYDPDIDTRIGHVNNGEPKDSSYYYEETLYRNQKGFPYLLVYGGHDMRHHTGPWGSDANIYGYGYRFFPMTEEEASAWLKKQAV